MHGLSPTGPAVKVVPIPSGPPAAPEIRRPTLRGHLRILRIDHWFKNVFVLPGVIVALSLDTAQATWGLMPRLVIGMLSICLLASSNYVLNELLDAPYDRRHPTKWQRPVPAGLVSVPLAYLQWIALMGVSLALARTISPEFTIVMAIFWIMGCAYNIPPIRTKDLPYIDVLTEAVNNPLRLLAGWYLVGTALVPPCSLLVSYWMIGCYFMAIKRFAEYRTIRNVERWTYIGRESLEAAAAYRRSFALSNEVSLLISVMFYAAASMLFFGAFLMRYRLELVLSFPFVALVLAVYQALAFKENSPVQTPEKLYRERLVMVPISICTALMVFLLFVDIPTLHQLFKPTLP